MDQLTRTVASQCRLCAAHCGVLATFEDGRLVKVAGDPEHPVSRGFTCPKGRAMPARHHGDDRLDDPLLDGARVGWDRLLDDAAGRLRALIDEHGPDAVGYYFGTGAVDLTGVATLGTLFEKLGSRQRYSSSSVDYAPILRASELVTGFPYVFPMWWPEDADPRVVLMIGTNPGVSMGYMGPAQSNWMHRLRGFQAGGGELWVIDPRRTKTAVRADHHLAARPGSDVFLLGWLVRELLAEGCDERELATACDADDVRRLREAVAAFDLESAVARTGLDPDELRTLLAAIRRHGKVAVLPGTGVSFGPDAVTTSWLVWVLMIITGSLDHPAGLPFLPPSPEALDEPPWTGHAPPEGSFEPGPASRPELHGAFGERPSVALADEIEAGEIRALIVFGGNPLTALPDPARTREALRGLDALIVLDPFSTELTAMATHALPSTWATEQAYLTYIESYGDGRTYAGAAMVPAAGERRPAWWSFAQLGRRLGVDVFDGALDADVADEEAVIRHFSPLSSPFIDEVLAAGSHGVAIPFRYGWLRDKVLPAGRWRLAPAAVVERLGRVWSSDVNGTRLIAGRVTRSLNSAHYARLPSDPPRVHVSRDLGRELAIEDGDVVRVSTAAGSLDGPASVEAALGSGTVWIEHGHSGLNPNMLTDAADIDPLTGQPSMTALPVTVERVGPAPAALVPPAT